MPGLHQALPLTSLPWPLPFCFKKRRLFCMKPSVRRDMKQHWRLNLGAQMSPELWRECRVAACAHARGALSPAHPRARTQHSGAPLPRPVSARPTQSWPSVAEALRLLQTV